MWETVDSGGDDSKDERLDSGFEFQPAQDKDIISLFAQLGPVSQAPNKVYFYPEAIAADAPYDHFAWSLGYGYVSAHGEGNLNVRTSHFPELFGGSEATNPKRLLFRKLGDCLLYTSPSPRDRQKSRMPSSA